MAFIIVLATIPAGLVGLLLDDWVEANLRTVFVVGCTTLGFGLLLGWADRKGGATTSAINWKVGLLIGAAQVLAIIPGTSRSGITMTAALMLGLDRDTSARFSFLLSIPLIAAAGGYKALKLAAQVGPVDWQALLVGALLSALAAYVCIHFFLKLLARVGFMPFVIYRVILGLLLLCWLWLLS
jgi:undecaprenyl-diphosphatase